VSITALWFILGITIGALVSGAVALWRGYQWGRADEYADQLTQQSVQQLQDTALERELQQQPPDPAWDTRMDYWLSLYGPARARTADPAPALTDSGELRKIRDWGDDMETRIKTGQIGGES
jgi:hypothetical protein